MSANPPVTRKRPAVLRALGDAEPPDAIEVAGRSFTREEVLKHDSWAATAIYRDAAGVRIIAKFNRAQSIFGVPMGWLGKALAQREAGFMRRLAHLDFVPDDLGPVSAGGRVLPNAVARTFIEGHAFTAETPVDLAFFQTLRRQLRQVHRTGMAYVDLHKRENILIDRQGQPHLVDFQVSFAGRGWPLRQLQHMDFYHYRKNYGRALAAGLTPQRFARCVEPPAMIQAHRQIAVPFRALRRRLLTLLRVRDASGQAGSELEPEDAFRER
ncbi:MAG TPA: hypothetical protein VGL58_04570 [Caulobacteraceae bacterium]|jgi:hypothetical protein